MISEGYITELQSIVRKKLGVELSYKDAKELAGFLIAYFEVLLEGSHE